MRERSERAGRVRLEGLLGNAVLAIPAIFVWSWLCNLVLDISTHVATPYFPWRGLFSHSWESMLSSSLISCLVMIVFGLTGRLWTAFGVTMSLCVVVAGINSGKSSIRREPLIPGDVQFLKTPHFLLDMVSTTDLLVAVLAPALFLVGA